MLRHSSLTYLEMSLSNNEKVVRLDIAVCIAHINTMNEIRSRLKAEYVHRTLWMTLRAVIAFAM
jgi:hypothetical protein